MEDTRLRAAIDRIVAGAENRPDLSAVDAPPKPQKKEIIEILRMLQEVVYPGFYGHTVLYRANLNDHLGDVLFRIHLSLANEIEKALTDGGRTHANAQDVATRFFETLPAIADLLAEDVRAAFDGDPAATGFDEIILAYPGVKAVFTYRLAHALHELGVPLIPRIMTEFAHLETGVDIHPGARIGRSFFIDHGTGTVIGETTDIGDRVKLYQGVTLGALSFPKNERGELIRGTKRHPTVDGRRRDLRGRDDPRRRDRDREGLRHRRQRLADRLRAAGHARHPAERPAPGGIAGPFPRFDHLTGPAGLTLSVESSRASARSRATVFPVPGTTRRAATSARGTRTNRRDVIRGCGTVRTRVRICSLP